MPAAAWRSGCCVDPRPRSIDRTTAVNRNGRRAVQSATTRLRGGQTSMRTRHARRADALDDGQRMPGAGLSCLTAKAVSDTPVSQPYWGKPSLRLRGRIEETSASFEVLPDQVSGQSNADSHHRKPRRVLLRNTRFGLSRSPRQVFSHLAVNLRSAVAATTTTTSATATSAKVPHAIELARPGPPGADAAFRESSEHANEPQSREARRHVRAAPSRRSASVATPTRAPLRL